MTRLTLLPTARTLRLLADTHFNHRRMIEEGHRPLWFTEMILAACSEECSAEDLLIFLGDVILSKESMLSEYLARISARKILVRGNHDTQKTNWYLERGFSLVCDQLFYGDVVMTHIPLKELPPGCRLNVHGHLHNDPHRFPEFKDILRPWHKLLAVEAVGYRPVELKEFIANGIQDYQ
jgi:calcineurin-like phosphoesterase family protein